jgi:hypothetical protein
MSIAKSVMIYKSTDFYSSEVDVLLRKALQANNIEVSNSPDLVICIGDILSFTDILVDCTRNKTSTVFIESSLLDNIFRDKNPPHNINIAHPEFLICSNRKQKEKFVELGLEDNKVFVCGNPLLDNIRSKTSEESKGIKVLFNKRCLERGHRANLSRLSGVSRGKVDYISTEYECNILQRLEEASHVVTEKSDLLIYSILKSKPTLLISSDPEDSIRYGIAPYEAATSLAEASLSLLEEHITFYLTSFLPGVLDSNNMMRILQVLNFLLHRKDSIHRYDEGLLSYFLDTYPQLKDPLHFIRKEAEEFFNGVVKF